jgi:class 3 adenylate cyclase
VEEGWLLLEGVAAAAVGGELGGYTTGGVFCNVISVCRDLADYGRASEWADAAKRWCERQSISGFPGVCRVHRAEVLRLLGAWTEAESEVRLACEELREFSPAQAGAAFHELGEVRLRQGDLAGAEEAFAQAEEFREDPQPGRSLLLAARGEPASAAASIRSSLDDTWNQLKRARLLPAQAAIALLTAEPDVARAAALELGSIAESFGTSAIRADAETAWGIVALLEGNHAGALERVRAARALWREVEAPYEIASASLLMASIHLERGDLPAARLEAEAARSTFERLGATPAVARSDELLLRLAPRGPSPDVTRRTFLFSDIVGSTRLIEAIGDEAWVALRRWHDDALRRSFDDHGGQEVDHAGDGFFVAFPDARHAVDCAIEIQRKLAAHRRDHGFAPRVRMGVHATEAIAHVGDYSGRGVHEAARIGAIATADEILASVATLEHLDGVRSGEPHDEQLKGLSEPVAVLAIEWRDA